MAPLKGELAAKRSEGLSPKGPTRYVQSLIFSKPHPHLMPSHPAVVRVRHALVCKPKLGIVRHQPVLACQHQPKLPSGPARGDGRLQELPGISLFLVLRVRCHAKDHLPLSRSVVEGGVFVHLVVQVRRVGTHAVDHGNGPVCLVRHHPKTNSNPKALLLGCRGTLAQNRGTNTILIPQKP